MVALYLHVYLWVVNVCLMCVLHITRSKLGRDEVLLLSTPVQYITKSGSRNPAHLLLTPDRIYLLNTTNNTFQQNFSISEYSLKECVAGSGNLEEVTIEIVMKSERTDTPKFHQVEYFLQLSQKETASGVFALPQIEQVPASPDLALPHQEVQACDDNQSQETKSVKLLIETHRATQLLSLYNTLSHLLIHPPTVFCVHKTLKQESFLSIINNSK